MEDYFLKLTEAEKKVLFQTPVYVSLLAALEDGKISKQEKKDATSLVHFRTFTSNPILHGYYKLAEDHFNDHLKEQEVELPENIEEARELLHNKLNEVNNILAKMNEEFTEELKQSLHSFANHIINVNSSWVKSLPLFINPLLEIKDKTSSEKLF